MEPLLRDAALEVVTSRAIKHASLVFQALNDAMLLSSLGGRFGEFQDDAGLGAWLMFLKA